MRDAALQALRLEPSASASQLARAGVHVYFRVVHVHALRMSIRRGRTASAELARDALVRPETNTAATRTDKMLSLANVATKRANVTFRNKSC